MKSLSWKWRVVWEVPLWEWNPSHRMVVSENEILLTEWWSLRSSSWKWNPWLHCNTSWNQRPPLENETSELVLQLSHELVSKMKWWFYSEKVLQWSHELVSKMKPLNWCCSEVMNQFLKWIQRPPLRRCCSEVMNWFLHQVLKMNSYSEIVETTSWNPWVENEITTSCSEVMNLLTGFENETSENEIVE